MPKNFENSRNADYRKSSIITIAGLDPSGCAGLLLDVRVIASLGFHPCGIVSAITFQNTCKGYGYESVSALSVERQLKSILEDMLIAGVKIGLLNSKEVAEVVSENLKEHAKVVVWDPVFRSTTELEFFEDDFAEIARILSAVTTVITPNVEEAKLLSGVEITNLATAEKAAKKISEKFNSAVIITGGELKGVDVAFNGKAFRVEAEYSPVEIRGTGCVYSSALTCYLAKGEELEDAARHSRLYLLESIKRAKLTGKCLPCCEAANL
jgi:hydroxymethylpyrimidine/phosphomethylpyrimidine kinase